MNRSLLAMCTALVLVGSGVLLWTARAPEPEAVAPNDSRAAGATAARAPSPSLPAAAASSKTPEQARLEERRWLYEMVDSLLANREIERARKHLDEGAARYGDDAAPEWRDLDSGYRLIADCMEQPAVAKHRVRARAFITVTEARSLVPKIRAACGE